MAVKRRVVWFSDREWERLKERATRENYGSPTRLIRSILGLAEDPEDRGRIDVTPPKRITQAERDAILRRVNKG